ncbi:unnamed protein product [Vitrella brassicaformis CCMP3155]|uniref:Aldehyde dehydrogenase domain-containing protein n=1 Tax=Vitrella brassicaformis (strain CCMP3155) TaxID=1169540 RepID=A0A0G4GCJ0_VITBC|nr:unnamed protein product [Vitrella brassicaformis CCMP3155]|eukprot:CEM26992.1 unnamed protein product [Vitrella brassicaformis CCMP3155]
MKHSLAFADRESKKARVDPQASAEPQTNQTEDNEPRMATEPSNLTNGTTETRDLAVESSTVDPSVPAADQQEEQQPAEAPDQSIVEPHQQRQHQPSLPQENGLPSCCIASSRIFVEESIYDDFVERALKRSKEAKLLDPKDPECTQGPQVDVKQFDRIINYIHTGKKEGATLLCGGNQYGSEGYWVEPTIFTDVKDDMRIAKEEIFGPVMCILKFKTLDEAITRANTTSYGLGAGICTRDIGKALTLAHKIRAGTIYINCYDVFTPEAPFGGYKQSGQGRELGESGLDAYLENKTVICDLSFKE